MSITVNKIIIDVYIQGVQFNKFKITFLFFFFFLDVSWDQHCIYQKKLELPCQTIRLWKGIIEEKQYVWNAVKLSIPLFIVNCPNFSYFLPFFLKMIPTFSPTFYINAVGRPSRLTNRYCHLCTLGRWAFQGRTYGFFERGGGSGPEFFKGGRVQVRGTWELLRGCNPPPQRTHLREF